MSKEYKTLLGNRVYIEIDMPNYSVEMPEEVKKKLTQDVAQKLNRAKVYDVGTSLETSSPVKVGDEVLVSKDGVIRGDFINLSPTKVVLMISPFDIIHIW